MPLLPVSHRFLASLPPHDFSWLAPQWATLARASSEHRLAPISNRQVAGSNSALHELRELVEIL